jgi:hypothetical protein
MTAILDNLISSLMFPIGFALDHLILSLRTPAGFVLTFSSMIFVEGVTLKSIVKDARRKRIRIKDVSKDVGVVSVNIRKRLTVINPLCILRIKVA